MKPLVGSISLCKNPVVKLLQSLFLLAIISPAVAQNESVNSLKVYWVGHSLMSAKDHGDPQARSLLELIEPLAESEGNDYSFYKHTTPGAPIGWNWGVADSWGGIESLIAPLIDDSDPEYGSFDAIVVTEGVNINSSYEWWASSFYARKFYNAALNANPNARLFLYESWHHYNGSDDNFRSYYGPQASYDWFEDMKESHQTWVNILEEAADPNKTAVVENYAFQGEGEDPGNGEDLLEVYLIPTGKVLVAILERLAAKNPGDNWHYADGVHGDTLTPEDFWVNPLLNFPEDLSTTAHGGNLDDIHPSDVLIYLNALTHYAVLYRKNPANLPALQSVPANVADIFKEVVWQVVTNDPHTGLSDATSPVSIQYSKQQVAPDRVLMGVNALGQKIDSAPGRSTPVVKF